MLIEILLKKVRRRKCDPLGPIDNIHSYISINRNFAKKVQRRKCDPQCPMDRPNLHNNDLKKFAQKSATQKV